LKKPLFSIIIPTYNSEATLSRALESVLNQTFKNYEILIMDGLSQDDTPCIVETYQKQCQNIKWFSQSDDGIYDAMNKGVNQSKGEWLYFMGSDDYLFDVNVLSNVFDQLQNMVCDVVYGNVFYKSRNSLYDGKFTYEKLTHENICHQAIFLKKAVFEMIGNFDLTYKTVADWQHNVRWFYNTNIKHQYINLTIAEYSDGGYSSQHKDHKFLNKKNEIFIKYGFFKLPLQTLITITTKIVKKHKKQNHYLYFIMYGCLLFCLKIKKSLSNF
jgi:glycosyltransferase involved in cell wall biosynthesis